MNETIISAYDTAQVLKALVISQIEAKGFNESTRDQINDELSYLHDCVNEVLESLADTYSK